MDASQVNQVVDKLAEKIGLAVDKVQPIAEEVVRQYAAREVFMARSLLAFSVLCITAAVMGAYSLCTMDDKESSEGKIVASIMAVMVGGFAFVGCIIVSSIKYGNAIAPLASILGL